MRNCPQFYVRRHGWFRWRVVSDFGDIERHVCGPFFRWITAARIQSAINMHVITGFDLGIQAAKKSGEANGS